MLKKSLKTEKTCRACTKTEAELASLFDKQNILDGLCYSDLITECTMYTVQEDDELPDLICFECISKVRAAYDFKKLYEESQRKLLALIESVKEIQIPPQPAEAIFYNCDDPLNISNGTDEPIIPLRMSTRNYSITTQRYDEQSSRSLPQKDQVKNLTTDDKPRPNKCPACSKEFIHRGHLRNHLNKVHKKEDKTDIDTVEKVIVKYGETFVVRALSPLEHELKPGSDAEDTHFDFETLNDDDVMTPHNTESVKSFKAELDISNGVTSEELTQPQDEARTENEKQNTIKKTKQNKIYSERRFQCEICHKSFKRNAHLKQHILCHSKLKPYECPTCKKRFNRSDNLKVHMANHGKKMFQCDNCPRSFGQSYLLKRHKDQAHSDEKPFLCSECGQRFVRNGDLAVHMRRHTGEKPFKCQYCNKGFTRSTEVYVHERYHTGEKRHVCSICGKAFQRPYNLVVHVRTHTGERPYQCSHCPKNFAQCSDLKAHIRRHTGERYKCDICPMGFVHAFMLNHHKRNVHGIDVPARIIRIAKIKSETRNPGIE